MPVPNYRPHNSNRNPIKLTIGKDRNAYRITLSANGSRRRFYCGALTQAEANQCKTKLQKAIDANPNDLTWLTTKDLSPYKVSETKPVKSDTSKNTLLDIWNRYTRSLNLTRYTEASHYKCIRSMLEKREPASLTDDSILNGYSRWTWHHRRSAIAKALTWNDSTEESKHWLNLRCPKQASKRKPIQPLSTSEATLLLSALSNDPNKWAILFLLETGVRIGELLAVRFSCIDVEQRTALICASLVKRRYGNKPNLSVVNPDGKTSDDRTVPLTRTLLEWIEQQPRRSPRQIIFRMSAQSLRSSITSAYKTTGIKPRKLSATRHTRLSWQARDFGLMSAARLAGHKDLSMVVRHYARDTADRLETTPLIE